MERWTNGEDKISFCLIWHSIFHDFPVFVLGFYLFFHLMLLPSCFIHPSFLSLSSNHTVLVSTVDSVHLLLSSAGCLSSPLEKEREHFKDHEHLCIVGYGNSPKLANCTLSRKLHQMWLQARIAVFSGFNSEILLSLPSIFKFIFWTQTCL